ncbi:hypothetical protein [Cupriavidus necator]
MAILIIHGIDKSDRREVRWLPWPSGRKFPVSAAHSLNKALLVMRQCSGLHGTQSVRQDLTTHALEKAARYLAMFPSPGFIEAFLLRYCGSD